MSKRLFASFLITSALTAAFVISAHAQAPAEQYTSFRPGQVWKDDKGVHINAHGGGLLVHNGRHYWFGEHKGPGQGGNVARDGVHGYSSDDLYHWQDEGLA